MKSIEHRLTSSASAASFYLALTTIDGLSSWWTKETLGNPEFGDSLYFSFGSYATFEFQVALLDQDKLVSWKFLSGNPDWENTFLTFVISETEGVTTIDFLHEGFADDFDNLENVKLTWQDYLSSLQDYCETGKGNPFDE